MMKLFSVLFALLFASVSAQTLTPLEIQWDVEDPVLTYTAATNTFTITTVHGVGVNWVTLGTYDVCPNGDANFNSATYQGSPFSYFLANLSFIIDNTFNWSFASDYWTNAWSFKIDVGNMAGTLYTESGGVGTLIFCMRYGLVDTTDLATFKLVNFRQMMVTITWDLTSGFDSIESFETQAIDEVEGTVDNIEFAVTASMCPTQPNTQPFNQGDEICIQVCADNGNVNAVGIDELDLWTTSPAASNAEQEVVDLGAPVGNIVNTPVCVDNCCSVNFILLGIFFPVDDLDSPDTATVNGDGSVTLSLLARRLESGRALEETKTVDFHTKFDISTKKDDSGASSLLGMAGAAGAMGAALLL